MSFKKSAALVAVILSLIMGFGACTRPLEGSASISAVVIQKGGVDVGETLELDMKDAVTATLTASVTKTGDISDAVQFTSATQTVATITSAGVLTLLTAGTSVITATAVADTDKKASFTLTVKDTRPPQSVTSVTINGSRTPGKTLGDRDFTMTATVVAENGAPETVTWSSDDTSVATINASTGIVSLKKAGPAVITATSTFNGAKSDSVTLTVSAQATSSDDAVPSGWELVGTDWGTDSAFEMYDGDTVAGRLPAFVRKASSTYFKTANINLSDFKTDDYDSGLLLKYGCWIYSSAEQVAVINLPYGYNTQNCPATYTVAANTWTWLQSDAFYSSERVNGYVQLTGAADKTIYISGSQLIREITDGSESASVERVFISGQTSITKAHDAAPFQIKAVIESAYEASTDITWTSSDHGVATVADFVGSGEFAVSGSTRSATVTIAGPGTCTITATSDFNGTKLAAVTLNVGAAPDAIPAGWERVTTTISADASAHSGMGAGFFTYTPGTPENDAYFPDSVYPAFATLNSAYFVSTETPATTFVSGSTIKYGCWIVSLKAQSIAIIMSNNPLAPMGLKQYNLAAGQWTWIETEAVAATVNMRAGIVFEFNNYPAPGASGMVGIRDLRLIKHSSPAVPAGWSLVDTPITNGSAEVPTGSTPPTITVGAEFFPYVSGPTDVLFPGGVLPDFAALSATSTYFISSEVKTTAFGAGSTIKFGCWVISAEAQGVGIAIGDLTGMQNGAQPYALAAGTWTWIETTAYVANNDLRGGINFTENDCMVAVRGLRLIKLDTTL